MLLQKITLENAEKMHSTLSQISADAGVTGYLMGLVRDTRLCVECNLKNRKANDLSDVKLINTVLDELNNIESELSAIMTDDIKNGLAIKK